MRIGAGLSMVRAALALAAALAAGPLAAQEADPPPPADWQDSVEDYADQDYANQAGEALRDERARRAEEDQIVVTGRAGQASRAEVQRQARAIAVGGNMFDVPLARFEQPLCPGIAGLATPTAALMVDRLRANARAVGLRVRDDGCDPNFIVAFVADGRAMLARMMEESPERFQYLDPVERRALLEPGPVHVFTDTVTASRDGFPIARGRNLVTHPQTESWMAHSHIYTSIRVDIMAVWVIVDRDAARGLSLQQLADYATMRGLVQTRPQQGLGISSILGLFNPDGPWPDGLTDFDRAYLAAVYDWIPNLPAAVRIGRVAAELRQIEAAREDGHGDGPGDGPGDEEAPVQP